VPGGKAERRYRILFERHWRRVLAYTRRRVGDESGAEDVAAEVFAVAWRRIGEIPAEHELAWLFGVARRVLANSRRSQARKDKLIQRLGSETYIREHSSGGEPGGLQEEYGDALRAALGRLRPVDAEVLRLALWEGMTQVEIAMVFGCRPGM
jgi:RNA polymerase sigma factor (sigma-70 family)